MFIGSKENLEAALLAIPLELERIRSELQAGLQETHNARPLEGARYLPAGGRGKAWSGHGRLVGWSVRAAGGAASVTLRDGDHDNADVIAVIDVPAGESRTAWFGPGGIDFGSLNLQRAGAGTVEGSIFIGAVD